MSDRDYCYPPDFTVLRNRLGLRDARTLDASRRSNAGEHGAMTRCIRQALV